MKEKELTGYPSIDKPWLKYYTEEEINTPLPECSVYEYIWENNKDHLDDIAINYFGNKISYRELFENIEKAANSLYKIGIRQGDIVAMIAVTIPETIYSFYALNKIGAIANLIDPRTSNDGIKEYITEVNSKYIITLDIAYSKILNSIDNTSVKQIILLSPLNSFPKYKKTLIDIIQKLKKAKTTLTSNSIYWSDLIAQGKKGNYKKAIYTKDTCCAIEHTGGTTGFPKGVMLTNDNFNAAVSQNKNSPLPIKRKDKFLNIMPPFIAYGMVLGIHTVLALGCESIIIPKFNPQDFSKLILKNRPAVIMGVPTHFENLMEDNKLNNVDLSFIKIALVGGDKILVDFENRVNNFFSKHNSHILLSKGYSMTEASATATFSYEIANKAGSAGIPNSKTIISAFDPETTKELKINEIGEICICTPTMMLGYYGKEKETHKTIQLHSDGKKWIHSGDLGYIDNDGCIFIEGRLKRIIIRFDGFKVFPTFIENVISTSQNVDTCCAVGIPDSTHTQGKLPVVFVVLKPNFLNKPLETKKELIDLCSQELPEYAQPYDFIFRDSLPLTPIGKVDYKALEKEAEKIYREKNENV